MAYLSYRPIEVADFAPYHEFLDDRGCLRYLLHPYPHDEELT